MRYRVDTRAGAPIPTADKSFTAHIGAIDRTAGTLATPIAIYVLDGWDWITTPGVDAHDLALLQLDRQVDEQPVEIADRSARGGDKIRALGWGLTDPAGVGTPPRDLQELDTKVVAARRCVTGAITTGDFCVDNPGGYRGSCYGDSGGPAAKEIDRRWQLVGVTSRSGDLLCGEEPTVYTDVPKNIAWIYDVMRLHIPPTRVLAPTAVASGR